MKGEGGPAGEAVFIGLFTIGGIPMLFFSFIHLTLALWRGANSRTFMVIFGLVLLLMVLSWMIFCPLCIAGALFSGFVAYYVCFTLFLFANLTLLRVSRHKTSLQSVIPFLAL